MAIKLILNHKTLPVYFHTIYVSFREKTIVWEEAEMPPVISVMNLDVFDKRRGYMELPFTMVYISTGKWFLGDDIGVLAVVFEM